MSITRDDVLASIGTSPAQGVAPAATPAAGEPSAVAGSGVVRETRTPIRGVRKHTAAAMVQSAFTAPHVTVFHTVDVTATMELLDSLREDRTLSAHRIGPLAVVAKAVCLALGRAPGLNSRVSVAYTIGVSGSLTFNPYATRQRRPRRY